MTIAGDRPPPEGANPEDNKDAGDESTGTAPIKKVSKLEPIASTIKPHYAIAQLSIDHHYNYFVCSVITGIAKAVKVSLEMLLELK